MPRALTLGNGHILVNFDHYGFVRDFYFPYVGLENHIGEGYFHRVGVFADGRLSWLDEDSWKVTVECEGDSLVGRTTAVNEDLKVSLFITDACYNEKNVLVRRVALRNMTAVKREIKIFFSHQFQMYQANMAYTAYFDPQTNSLIHYRNQRAFLANAQIEGRPFDDYSTGVFNSEGKEGTHRDAEDGFLSRNPIEHGQADSVLGVTSEYGPQEEKNILYWLTAGQSIKEAIELNAYVLQAGANHMLETTEDYWRAWVTRRKYNFYGLDKNTASLFYKSQLFIRAHIDNNGSVLASGDSSMLQKGGKDTYAYMWPRDAAYTAMTMDKAGDDVVTKKFFEFCSDIITDEGYFMHKYSPDRSLGSSWHPWMRNGEMKLPIQEDETAIVIYALWNYYHLSKDLEFVEDVYNSLIKRAADFMTQYLDEKTGLPKASYDLWEEKFGISTYTASCVYGALLAAAKFANLLGKIKSEKRYEAAAADIKEAILKHLYDSDAKIFYKMINTDKEEITYDRTIDMSSAYGLFYFGVLEPTDPRLAAFIKVIEQELVCTGEIGGVVRYKGDDYYKVSANQPGNPWFVTSLWLAQYYIALAKTDDDLQPARDWLRFVVKNATPSGVLSEQLNPLSGEPLSASPLTWSHSEFVYTVITYLDKVQELGLGENVELVDPVADRFEQGLGLPA